MLVRFYDIQWDTSDDEMNEIEPPDLPTDVTLTVDNDLDIANEGADVLSDKYGFCVSSFNFEELPKYIVTYETYDNETNEYDKNCSMTFHADDEIHAVNQLLDFYKDLSERVSVIENVRKA